MREGSVLQSIDPEDIIWVEAVDQYARIHTATGTHVLSRSLTNLERDLSSRAFYRIHRSVLVNSAFVTEVRTEKNGAGSVLTTTGKRLRVSRRRRDLLQQLLRHTTRKH